MIISGITPPQVWAASARSLTNIGSGALAATSVVQTSIAASGTANIQPSAGTVGMATVSVLTGVGATGNCAIRLNDGTHAQSIAISSSGAQQQTQFSGPTTNSVFMTAANNDGAVAATYIVAAWVFTI